MPADRPGGYAGVGAQFELAGEQVLHAILVHDQHDQINRLAADLQSEASTFDSEECRSAPPFRRTATGHAAAIARTHNKSTLQHGWHHRHTFRPAQYFLWNTLIRRLLNLIQNVRRDLQTLFSLNRFCAVFVSSQRFSNYKDTHTYY